MTQRCERFEREALLRIEQGLPLEEHFQSCPDCLEAHATYQRIRGELRHPRVESPPTGWEQKVLNALDRISAAGPAPRRRSISWMAAGAVAAAAALVLGVLRVRGKEDRLVPRPPAGLGLATEVVHDASLEETRGNMARPGDRLRMRAFSASARFAELRVYRDDRELVMRCAPPPAPQHAPSGGDFSCSREGAILSGELRLGSIGAFQAFVATSDSPLPAPAVTVAEDTERLIAAGAHLALAPAVRVY